MEEEEIIKVLCSISFASSVLFFTRQSYYLHVFTLQNYRSSQSNIILELLTLYFELRACLLSSKANF